MKTFLLIYLIGFLLSGIFYKLLYSNKSFYEHRIRIIQEVKKQESMANTDIMDMDDEHIIERDIIFTMFMSYVGIIFIGIAIIGWKNDNIMF